MHRKLGAWLGAEAMLPQLAYCSTATRTRETLAGLSPLLPTILSEKLYLASPNELLAQLQTTDDAIHEVLLVAHNPGIHGLLALLAGDFANAQDADHMLAKFPTCTLAVLSAPLASWQELAPHSARLEQLRFSA